MGAICMDLYLKTERLRYRRGNRAAKKRILDQFCETYGYHRKAAARLLRQAPISDRKPQKPGKKKTYEPDVLLEPLKKIWLATDQNWHLIRYFTERAPKQQSIQFTRSRPYHSNDNAHVERRWQMKCQQTLRLFVLIFAKI